jgi:ankyrin repeat protein
MSNINKKNKELNNLIDQYITVYNTIAINRKYLSNIIEKYLKYNKEINFIKKFKMNYYTFILGKFILDLYERISYLLNHDLKIKKEFDINILSELLKLSISIIDLLINLGADINMIYYNSDNIGSGKFYTILLFAIQIFYMSSYITTDFKELVYYLINKNIDLNINLKYSEIVSNIHDLNPGISFIRTPINQVLFEIDKLINYHYKSERFLNLKKIEIFTEFIKLFIENGENINYIDKSNKSSLILSIPLNVFEIVEILVKAGININAVDEDGYTSLMLSIKRRESEKIILFLIENGTNLKLINKDRKSALDLAKKYCNDNIISIIKKKLVNDFNNIFRNINSNKDNFNINVNDLVFITNGEYFGYIFKIIEIKENKKYDVLFIFKNINIISSHNIIINNKNKNTNFINISNKNNLINSIGYIIDGSDKGCLIEIDDIKNNIYNVSYIKINNKIIKNIKCLNNISIDNVIYK